MSTVILTVRQRDVGRVTKSEFQTTGFFNVRSKFKKCRGVYFNDRYGQRTYGFFFLNFTGNLIEQPWSILSHELIVLSFLGVLSRFPI